MRLIKYILASMLVFVAISAHAEYRAQTVYVYGFAASFNDSTVYLTNIYELDSAYIDSKTKFLYSRNNYSEQLRYYLESIGFKNPVCITSFGLSRQEAEKKYTKLRKRYLETKGYNVKYIEAKDFKYEPVKISAEEIASK